MAKKDKQLLALGLIALGAFLLFRKKTTTTAPPVVAPDVETIAPQARRQVIIDKTKVSRQISGYFASQLPGARPDMAFGVRWGNGENFADTSRKANMVL